MSGYIFFGSAVKILEQVKRNVVIENTNPLCSTSLYGDDAEPSRGTSTHVLSSTLPNNTGNIELTGGTSTHEFPSSLSNNFLHTAYQSSTIDMLPTVHGIENGGTAECSNPFWEEKGDGDSSSKPARRRSSAGSTLREERTEPPNDGHSRSRSSSAIAQYGLTEIAGTPSVYSMTADEIGAHYDQWRAIQGVEMSTSICSFSPAMSSTSAQIIYHAHHAPINPTVSPTPTSDTNGGRSEQLLFNLEAAIESPLDTLTPNATYNISEEDLEMGAHPPFKSVTSLVDDNLTSRKSEGNLSPSLALLSDNTNVLSLPVRKSQTESDFDVCAHSNIDSVMPVGSTQNLLRPVESDSMLSLQLSRSRRSSKSSTSISNRMFSTMTEALTKSTNSLGGMEGSWKDLEYNNRNDNNNSSKMEISSSYADNKNNNNNNTHNNNSSLKVSSLSVLDMIWGCQTVFQSRQQRIALQKYHSLSGEPALPSYDIPPPPSPLSKPGTGMKETPMGSKGSPMATSCLSPPPAPSNILSYGSSDSCPGMLMSNHTVHNNSSSKSMNNTSSSKHNYKKISKDEITSLPFQQQVGMNDGLDPDTSAQNNYHSRNQTIIQPTISSDPSINPLYTARDLSKLVKTEYLVLDFGNVLGVDATAARSCFLMLKQLMRASGVILVFTNVSPVVKGLLIAHGVLTEEDIIQTDLDCALEWCEEKILERYCMISCIIVLNDYEHIYLNLSSKFICNRFCHYDLFINISVVRCYGGRGGVSRAAADASASLATVSNPLLVLSLTKPMSRSPAPGVEEANIAYSHHSNVGSNYKSFDLENGMTMEEAMQPSRSISAIHRIGNLRRILLDYLEVDETVSVKSVLQHFQEDILARYFQLSEATVGEVLYDRGQSAKKVRKLQYVYVYV